MNPGPPPDARSEASTGAHPILVAGVGNLFLGDDGFGVEVVRRLGAGPLPPGVSAHDYGIRGLHLAYALLDGPRLLIVIDAADQGEPAGTLFVLQPDTLDLTGPDSGADAPDPHAMTVPAVLASAAAILRLLGGALPRVIVVGCQPACLDEGIGLSTAVAAAVQPAVDLVRATLERELSAPATPAVEEEKTTHANHT